MRLVLAAVLLTGCGRVGFEPGQLRDGSIGGDDDAATDDGAQAQCTHQLCDGFESATLASVWTTSTANGGTVNPDTTIAHGGTSSLKLSLPSLASGGARAGLYEMSTITVGSPTFYVRAFVRFSALAATLNRIEVLFVTEQTNGFEDSVFLTDSSLALYNQWSDGTVGNASPPPTDTWLCLVWRVTRATTTTGSLALSGDVPVASFANIQTEGPALSLMGFGPHLYSANQVSPQPPLDMWLDDVLVDATPLTCSD